MGLATLLLASVAAYLFFATLSLALALPPAGAYFYYTLAVAALSLGLALLSLKKYSLAPRRPTRADVALLALVFLAWLVYRRPVFLAHSVWLDEVTQFYGSPRFDPVSFAAWQQQPPLDYILSAFARLAFGISPLSIVAHALAFGLLSLGAFALWLRRIRFPALLWPVPLILFSAQHILLQYSSEARPISIGVFFSLLWLLFAWDWLETGTTRARECTAAATLLLFSCSLQPLFFLGLLGLALLPVALYRRGRGAIPIFAYAFGLPLVLFVPIGYRIYELSLRAEQFRAGSLAERWSEAARALNWSSLWVFENSLRHGHVVILGAIFVAFAAWALRFRRGPASLLTPLLAAGAGFYYVAFPLVFLVFWSSVNWGLFPHYFVLWPVGLIALASLAFALGCELWPRGARVRGALGLLLCLGTAAYLHHTFVPYHLDFVRRVRGLRPEWKDVVALATPGEKTLFIELPYAPYSFFGYGIYYYVAGAAYATPLTLVSSLFENDARAKYGVDFPLPRFTGVREHGGPAEVFFLVNTEFSGEGAEESLRKAFAPFTREVIGSVRGYLIFRAGKVRSPAVLTEEVSRAIVKTAPRPAHFYLTDALLAASLERGDAPEAKRYLEALRRMDTSDPHADAATLKKYLGELGRQVDALGAAKRTN